MNNVHYLHISLRIINRNDIYEAFYYILKNAVWNNHGRLQFYAILTRRNERKKCIVMLELSFLSLLLMHMLSYSDDCMIFSLNYYLQ